MRFFVINIVVIICEHESSPVYIGNTCVAFLKLKCMVTVSRESVKIACNVNVGFSNVVHTNAASS